MGKEERIRAITQIYYMNPKVQKALLDFSKDREIVPSYMMQAFGKRPDILQYVSDISGLVKKGATSFHASEELWSNPLDLSSESTLKDLRELRKGWDLLIDIDSPYLDCSKIAAKLILKTLEEYGVKNYGIKFSGSKGFHIIVGNKAFPKEFNEEIRSESFPEWPRAICEFITNKIRPEYNRETGKMDINFEALEKRTKLKKEDLQEAVCPNCNRPGKKGKIAKFVCPVCSTTIERKNYKITKRRLRCLNESCAGVLEVMNEKDYFHCEFCDKSSWDKFGGEGSGKVVYSEKREDVEVFEEGISGNKMAGMDLILVASRHLFRMPYSLHEKTALASIVIEKNEIEGFNPRDANPMKVKIRNFMPDNKEGEATKLLAGALEWKNKQESEEKKMGELKYGKGMKKKYEDVELKGVTEDMFPPAINKLLKGLEDGRKRGLFVLLTFLRSCGFSPEYINKKSRAWNEKNDPPLKEGYIRSQIDWHLRQNKKILPPNYSNDAFYGDIGIIDKKPMTKNPLVDVMRKMRG